MEEQGMPQKKHKPEEIVANLDTSKYLGKSAAI